MADPIENGPCGTEHTLSDNGALGILRGTKIATRNGEHPVEELRPGDHVMVRDGGFAPVRWIGSYTAGARGDAFERAAPVKIPRGALGKRQPNRDLYVSPNHRVWMRDASYEMLFDTREVLIPAKQLVGWRGITQVSYVPQPEYFHFLFDRHQVVLTDGVLSESFHPGEMALDQFENEARDDLLRMFPDLLQVAAEGKTARPCLTPHETPLALAAKSVA
ncbi:MAG: Hint domain-containing protein, partial [Shimia sp.]|nr:Hint domain-containing protein [Shimia sp.]